MQQVIYTNLVIEALDDLVSSMGTPNVFVLVDSNTAKFVLPILSNQSKVVSQAKIITVPSGDVNKTIAALQTIWKGLSTEGASRKSVIINVGGGVITDIGGFAATTFKRGIRFVNLPTTLLGAVDAAVGGKTGINFNGLKNEIGAFSDAEAVIISTTFFNTLPDQQLLSGYAEMLKHGLLDNPATLAALMKHDVTHGTAASDRLLQLIQQSVQVKQAIVSSDPHETGMRKALNLGHTVGHAFESFAMNDRVSPIPHGYAVAWGLVVELILSHMRLGFPAETLHQFAAYVKEHYGYFDVECKDYPVLISLMRHDKKNDTQQDINFTLLRDVGRIEINQTASEDDIKAALDIYRDMLS